MVGPAGVITGSAVTSTAAGAASPPKSVNVGIVCGCTGPLASSIAVVPPAYQAWVDQTNATGGVSGYKIKLIVKDDDSNPVTSLAEVQQLVTQDHVIALVDATDVDTSWATFVKDRGIPVIGQNVSQEPFFTNSDFYAVGQTEDQLFASIVGAAKKAGAKNMALLYCAEAASCQQGVAPLKATAAAEGVPLIYDASVSASSPNYTAQCLAAQQSGAQAVFIADAVGVIESVAQGCARQGYTPKIIIDGASLAPSMAKAPGLADYTVFENGNIPYFATFNRAIATMTLAFRKYSPSLMKSADFNELAVETWASGVLLATAAKAGKLGSNGAATAEQLVAGLHTLRSNTLGGISPPLTFVSTKAANPVDCWQGYTVLKGGKFSTPYGLGPNCSKHSG
jgi:branched-chain amino acid transport system substrate-binding protein